MKMIPEIKKLTTQSSKVRFEWRLKSRSLRGVTTGPRAEETWGEDRTLSPHAAAAAEGGEDKDTDSVRQGRHSIFLRG
jgi:hypothetical protein